MRCPRPCPPCRSTTSRERSRNDLLNCIFVVDSAPLGVSRHPCRRQRPAGNEQQSRTTRWKTRSTEQRGERDRPKSICLPTRPVTTMIDDPIPYHLDDVRNDPDSDPLYLTSISTVTYSISTYLYLHTGSDPRISDNVSLLFILFLVFLFNLTPLVLARLHCRPPICASLAASAAPLQ